MPRLSLGWRCLFVTRHHRLLTVVVWWLRWLELSSRFRRSVLERSLPRRSPTSGHGRVACCQHQPTAISIRLSTARVAGATTHFLSRFCNSHSNAAAAVFLVRLALQIGDMLSSIPRTQLAAHSQGTSVAALAGLARELWPRAC